MRLLQLCGKGVQLFRPLVEDFRPLDEEFVQLIGVALKPVRAFPPFVGAAVVLVCEIACTGAGYEKAEGEHGGQNVRKGPSQAVAGARAGVTL